MTYVHSVLKSALEHAVREDELPRNVARNVKTTAPRPRRLQPLTAAEARQFLDTARTDRLHAVYELALRTGLRKGELLGLHREDLDLNARSVAIRCPQSRENFTPAQNSYLRPTRSWASQTADNRPRRLCRGRCL